MTRNNYRTLGDLRAKIVDELTELDSPLLEADLILAGCAGRDRSWVHAHARDEVSREFCERVLALTERRKNREPLQYLLGECDFDGLPVIVEPGCLVPRPETELLVECAARFFDGGTFLDWGTGTGCIALALLNRFANARGILVEKNPRSIACARKNLAKFNFEGRARIIESESPDDIPDLHVSLVVSNPPYVPSGEIENLMPEVSRWEPKIALDGGRDGLEFYAPLFRLCERILTPDGYFCVEYGGASQTESLRRLAPENFHEEALLRDIAGHERVLTWKFAPALT